MNIIFVSLIFSLSNMYILNVCIHIFIIFKVYMLYDYNNSITAPDLHVLYPITNS